MPKSLSTRASWYVRKSAPPSEPTEAGDGSVMFGVSGRLRLRGGGFTTQVDCEGPGGQPCCNQVGKPAILVTETGSVYEVPGFGCFGDDSRVCCNVKADGQLVLVTAPLDEVNLSAFWRAAGGVSYKANVCKL